MRESPSADTSLTTETCETHDQVVRNNLLGFVLFLRLASATAYGVHKCFWRDTAATQLSGGTAYESSTQPQDITPELWMTLGAVLDAARRDIIEDGMANAISEQLPALVVRGSNAVITALASAIDTGRVTPVISAEILKELGRLRNTASYASQRWVLERALFSPWPFVRDGAGLGLARLGDPGAIPVLRKAVESETHAQTKADLQLVLDELSESMTNGQSFAHNH